MRAWGSISFPGSARARACALSPAWFFLSLALLFSPRQAHAWELFRSENTDVKRGNELLAEGKAEEATQAFEAAQKKLPGDAGVNLNRGLGLMATDKLPEAREAFRAAVQSASTPELRSKAHYNLGLNFLREADALGEDLEQAQKLLTESVDSFKNALRNGPKNRDAAWNLELAKRRLVDLENKKQQQEQEKKDQEKQEQEKNEQEKNEQEKNEQEKNEQEQKKDESDQEQKPDGQDPKESDKPEDKKGDSPDDKKPDSPENKPAQNKPEENKPEEPKPQERQPEPAPQKPQDALPEHMQRALDALSENDDNLQKQRAKARARQRPQRIEKDW